MFTKSPTLFHNFLQYRSGRHGNRQCAGFKYGANSDRAEGVLACSDWRKFAPLDPSRVEYLRAGRRKAVDGSAAAAAIMVSTAKNGVGPACWSGGLSDVHSETMRRRKKGITLSHDTLVGRP